MSDYVEKASLVALSCLAAVLRVCGVKGILFQAFAHCLVGFLFGAGTRRDYSGGWSKAIYLALAFILTFVETVCFLHSKFG